MTFSYFSELYDFVKIEPPCRRELDFEGQAAPNVTFSPLEPLPKIRTILEAHEWGGGGPPGKT